jgi:hypothetical protein
MKLMSLPNVHIHINAYELRRRLFELIPGTLAWGTVIGLAVLAFITPFWIAIFVIAYDLYILIRAMYMSVHLLYAYRTLRWYRSVPWLRKCQDARGHLPWNKVHHAIVLPTYDESLEVLQSSLRSLVATDFPKEQMHVVVGFEERGGEAARQRALALQHEFGDSFQTFLTTFHPDGLPGERRVKSANATWALKEIEQAIYQQGIETDQVLVSNFDSDTVVSPSYFSYLTYVFITHPTPYRVSYQPLPMYNNNVWDAPAFSRVIATGSTFWQMIESTRPERLVTFSSHSMTLKALKEVGYWHKDIISEDSRIFWQCLLHYNGQYSTEPLYTTVSMDAALGATWWQTLKNQYKQKRRWAWGIENFPYLAEGFYRNRRIPWRVKVTYLFRTLEGHHSWATTPIIVAGLGWLPIFFGGPEFQTTVLSYSLPFVTRTIMSIAMFGLLISTALSMLLLPPRPPDYSRWRYFGIVGQWALVPFIATLLSAFPALDAETRLLLGRDLQFNVMQKVRKRAI